MKEVIEKAKKVEEEKWARTHGRKLEKRRQLIVSKQEQEYLCVKEKLQKSIDEKLKTRFEELEK